MPVTLELGRRKQEDQEFKSSTETQQKKIRQKNRVFEVFLGHMRPCLKEKNKEISTTEAFNPNPGACRPPWGRDCSAIPALGLSVSVDLLIFLGCYVMSSAGSQKGQEEKKQSTHLTEARHRRVSFPPSHLSR